MSNLGSEVKSEPVWCNEGAPLISLTKNLPQSKVQSMCACVVLHGIATTILYGIHNASMNAQTNIYR